MLERDAADELLAELGGRWEPVARLTQDERDRLYAETGGNPLLLTWVTGQLGRTTGRCRTVAEAVERLQEAHRLQTVNEENDPLDFVFGDLVETIKTDETAVLAALVHFSQPVPIELLLPLVGLSRKAAETALDGLRDRALLVEDDQAGTWLLPPLASRFLRRACPEEVRVSGERLADQARALAEENGFQEYARFSVLDACWPQLSAALPVLITGDNARLQNVCNALEMFLRSSGRWDDLLSLCTEAERTAERAGTFKDAGWRAWQAGFCHYLRGQSADVLACADRAAAHWKKERVGAYEHASTIRLRGIGHELARDYPAAIAAYRKALELWRSLSPRSLNVADGLNDLAEALRQSGQLDEAESHFREALAIAQALQLAQGVAVYTGNLIGLALDRENWHEAENLAREALRLAEEAGIKDMIASDCSRLAKALVQQGRGAEGRSHAERAVAIYTELRSPELSGAQAVLDDCQRPLKSVKN
jgi:tetratricopeptide (TPR) repeat protein